MTEKKIVVTSALPYANGPIHLGHMVEYIQTDIFARFLKLTGRHAIYCCADDTHGAPIEIKASLLGIKPEELIEKCHKEHLQDFQDFQIGFDSYYSTNSPENKAFSDQIFLINQKKGHIYTKEVENTYCEKCKRFLPDRYVKGQCPKCREKDQYGDVCEKCNATYNTVDLVEPYCTICQSRPGRRSSKHYFFRLSNFSSRLKDWITGNPELQQEVKNFILNWIKDGLTDWCISRDGPYFGFNIPGEEDKYYYVWLDAPIGYIASTAHYCKKTGERLEDYWQDGEIIHIIGKDIMYFHYLFWPAILMDTGFSLPKRLMTHGFLTVDGEKMSKSRGTFILARDYLDLLKPDYLRYYYASNLTSRLSDLDLSFDDFKARCNNELVGNIINFTYRILNFINSNLDSRVGKCTHKFDLDYSRIRDCFSRFEFRDAVKEINSIVAKGNRYFQENEPWKMIKQDKAGAESILANSFQLVKDISVLVYPILPEFSRELRTQMNLPDPNWGDLGMDVEDHSISQATVIIKKIDKELESLSGAKECILELVAAKVLEAGPHPDADKLIVMKIDIGSEKRQLVAGIRDFYSPEEMVGRMLILVKNLKPAKLRGIESNGMLLAATGDSKVIVLDPGDAEPGEEMNFEGLNHRKRQITFEEFKKLRISTKGRYVMLEGKKLQRKGKDLQFEIEDGLRVR